MKYQLPEVVQLKQIGFKFEFETINEFYDYSRKFVKEHDDELFNLLIPDFYCEKYEETFECDSYPYYPINDAKERIERLTQGIIKKKDYWFVVHPVHKNKANVLLSAWKKRKTRFGLDSKVLLNYPKIFGLSPVEAIHLTLLNELYRIIICLFPMESFKPLPKKYESDYQVSIDKLYQKLDELTKKDKLIAAGIRSSIEKLKEAEYEEYFERKISGPERITLIFIKILTIFAFDAIYQTTNIEDKEKVIRYFLKTQTSAVLKSKNTRGKGIHVTKMKKILQYFSDYPNANNSQVAKALKVSRNTVRKYRPN